MSTSSTSSGVRVFSAAQVSLAVALSGLILLNVIDHDFQTAADSAMIEIESETANLERLATALVLPGIYPRRQRVKDLVVAGEECALVNSVIALVNCGFSALAEITMLSCTGGME